MVVAKKENDALTQDLSQWLQPDQILTSPAARRGYDCDAYVVDRFPPAIILLPTSTDEISNVVKYCHKNSIPFTARGAGTGLSGGALPALGGILISTKRMTKILRVEPENQILEAQAGATNKSLSDACLQYGLHFAPDPSSGTVCTLGGNIAENSGGPHTLKYGVTSGHVLQVTMVEPEGNVWEIGSETAGAPGLDFLSLIVGGEGTLGVVTQSVVRLTPLAKFVKTSLASFPTVHDATECVASIIQSGIIPAALEMMDHGILAALRAAFGLQYPEDANALLLIECDGNDEAIVLSEMKSVRALCAEHKSLDFELAADEKGRKALWKARKQGIGAMGRVAPTVITHDGVIPRSKLPEMLETVYQIAAEYGLGVANIFHAGDGNLHPCFYFDDRVPGVVDRVVRAGDTLMRRCIELGGSATGEHGIGVEKLDLMPMMFGDNGLKMQADAKAIFNKSSMCNPCKVLPHQKSCVEHAKRWRGVAT